MRRKQLYIDDGLDEALKRLAAETGRSEADHVREALRAYLPDEPPVPRGDDPLLAFVGVITDDDAPDDLARELDHYAYGVPKGHKGKTRR
jgi:plasmid stability protein